MSSPDVAQTQQQSTFSIFLIFLRLGLTSFGGPVAHLGYFRAELVARRRWLTESSYADLVALCQFLPGPASSQVGLALGLSRGGYRGAMAAWAGFTMPSAIALILFALGLSSHPEAVPPGLLYGMKVVAVAVVAQAVWGMAQKLCPDRQRVTIMALATCLTLWMPFAWGQVAVIIAAGVVGMLLFKTPEITHREPLSLEISKRAGLGWLGLFALLLVGLPIVAQLFPDHRIQVVDAFFRTGSLVFGGGHVVLPLLQAEVVHPGWINNETFLAGYGAAQAVPGPLFTFSAFLGAAMNEPAGWLGGMMCLLAIFAPSFMLIAGALPFWELLRRNAHAQSALTGINSAVVGLLLAALYQPVWTSAIHGPQDFALALVAFVALLFWKLPPWLVVGGSGIAGWFMTLNG